MAGNVPTPPAATCAPVRGDTSPAQTAPDVSVRLFHSHKHKCMLTRVPVTLQSGVASEPCIILLV